MSRSEAFSRVLIDQTLKESGWNLLDPQQVTFEISGSSGRADYVLRGLHGPLCVLEAKRQDLDPYDAKEQARGYAENLKAPFVILSNGIVHYFWNYARADQRDAYRIERLPSPTDLERLRLKNLQPPRPLGSENIRPDYLKSLNPDITLRGYQIKALEEIAKQFDGMGRRKFLLEMATGTGKTLLCAALIRRFLTTRNAERVLFIVDRIELAKQTMEAPSRPGRPFDALIVQTRRRRESGVPPARPAMGGRRGPRARTHGCRRAAARSRPSSRRPPASAPAGPPRRRRGRFPRRSRARSGGAPRCGAPRRRGARARSARRA